MEKLRALPVGIQNFRKLMTVGSAYVEKYSMFRILCLKCALLCAAIMIVAVFSSACSSRTAGDVSYDSEQSMQTASAGEQNAQVSDSPVQEAAQYPGTAVTVCEIGAGNAAVGYEHESNIWAQVMSNLRPDMLAAIEHQANVDAMLLAELNSGLYSFEDPFVVIDPYGMSPLTALALFKTDEPMNISVHVPGRTALADVSFTFEGYNTVHQIPILGLLPAHVNMVTLMGETQAGTQSSNVLTLRTDVLPPELAGDIILTDLVQPERIGPGLNFTYAYKTAFDVNGDYRWFYNDFFLRGFALYNYNGNMVFARGAYHQGDVLILEVNKLGKILSVFHSPYGNHHDITDRDGGNLLINGSFGDTVEDFIYEIDVQTGEIVNRLDLKRILQRTRIEGFPIFDPVDWFHHNATVYVDGDIIISGRRQSTVARMSWPDGRIRWILSDHDGWNQMFHQYLLTPIGEDFEWSFGQHTPIILPDLDNNPDTIDIMLFDNGNGRFDDVWQLYSRMVHYRINEADMTIEQIWQFGRELGFPYFAEGWSSVQFLDNGNRLGAFDRYISAHGGSINANIIEVDEEGNRIWEAFGTSSSWNGSFHVYRVSRMPLYNDSLNDLRIGIPARTFIPERQLVVRG